MQRTYDKDYAECAEEDTLHFLLNFDCLTCRLKIDFAKTPSLLTIIKLSKFVKQFFAFNLKLKKLKGKRKIRSVFDIASFQKLLLFN